MSLKEKIINEIIEREGGYVNNPNDSGGPTMYGITIAIASAYGWKRPMDQFPRSYAFDIYQKMYWDNLNLTNVELIYPRVAEKLADMGVNIGIGRAAEFLQRSLSVLNNQGKDYPDLKIDGSIGGQTISALTSYRQKRGSDGQIVLVKMLNSLQGAHYISLAERRQKDETFIFGWFKNRIA